MCQKYFFKLTQGRKRPDNLKVTDKFKWKKLNLLKQTTITKRILFIK